VKPVDPRLFRQAGPARRYLVLCTVSGLADAVLILLQAQALATVVAAGFLHGLTVRGATPWLVTAAAAALGRGTLAWAGESAAPPTSAAG
jgi:hypothetical protein